MCLEWTNVRVKGHHASPAISECERDEKFPARELGGPPCRKGPSCECIGIGSGEDEGCNMSPERNCGSGPMLSEKKSINIINTDLRCSTQIRVQIFPH